MDLGVWNPPRMTTVLNPIRDNGFMMFSFLYHQERISVAIIKNERDTYVYVFEQRYLAEIEKIAEWIAKIRIELKKNVIRKQEREWLNQEMYAYMHDIFGPEVIEIFDMTYNPDDNKLKG